MHLDAPPAIVGDMSSLPRLLPLAAAALLLPAGAASGASFTGTTAQGTPITFEADGDRVANVVSSLTMVCTGPSGIEPFQPSGAFTANGAESKLTELRQSAVLGREATHDFAFTGTISGSQASGKIALSYATTNFDVFTMTTTVVVCGGSTDFTATAPPASPAPAKADAPAARDPKPKRAAKRKAKHRTGKHAKRKAVARPRS